jgi:hypothetical protein
MSGIHCDAKSLSKCATFCLSAVKTVIQSNCDTSYKCQCGAPYEDSIHYLMECPLYQNERYCLFRNLRETNKNIETLLVGNDEISINENSNIFNPHLISYFDFIISVYMFSLILFYCK